MKITSILFSGSLFCVIAFMGCLKKDSLIQLADVTFSHTYDQEVSANTGLPNASDTVISSPFPINNYALPPYAFATNIGQIASDNNTSSEKLVSVKVDSLILSVTAPPNLTLDFVKNLKLYISADGQPEVLAAEKDPVPAGQRTVALDIRAGELKPYFQQDTVRLRIVASLTGIPPASTKVNLRNIIRVTANPLK